RRLVVSSSGAAYGYHPDNPAWLTEDDPVRGNPEFSYSDHKRQVEELLADARAEHPELEQVVFRIGTILGESVRNQITALFERRRLLVVRGSVSPFVFIWDEDVAAAMEHAVTGERTGVVNLAGEGAVTVPELARLMGKRTVTVPASVLALALRLGHALHLTPHGPERVGCARSSASRRARPHGRRFWRGGRHARADRTIALPFRGRGLREPAPRLTLAASLGSVARCPSTAPPKGSFMLTLTPTASTVIENLVSREADPQTAGLRIDSGGPQSTEFAVAVAPEPQPGDQVVEAGAARVFLESNASVALDEKVLDAQVSEEGAVRFAIGDQAPAE
ncbi:MAG: NAD-dependent epimerase/dehydratase family protein, partial [Microcella pacifica]